MVLIFKLAIIFLSVLLWVCIAAFLRLKEKTSFSYLLFFTIFYIYIFSVLHYTLFQFQSLILLKYFLPNLILNGQKEGESLNLVPLINLTVQDVKTSLLNILLFVPFGFGIPFITDFSFKKVIIGGFLFSVAIELLQLLTGLLTDKTFRIADINDVIFNTLGAAIGYAIFVSFILIYRQIFQRWNPPVNPILRYISERPQK